MFTGIIEEVGTVAELSTHERGGRVRIECSKVLPKLKVASSIAVSGCCLTVVAKDDKSFSCDLAPETLNRTGFQRLEVGAKLNLETCLTHDKPLDGHIVQGHVDGTGTLAGLTEAGDDPSTNSGQGNWWLDVDVPDNLTRYLVEKGSVAVEGISLTVAAIESTPVLRPVRRSLPAQAGLGEDGSLGVGGRLRIAIIPLTYRETNLCSLKKGDPINLECDVLAKYLEKLLQERPGTATLPKQLSENLTIERLTEEGF